MASSAPVPTSPLRRPIIRQEGRIDDTPGSTNGRVAPQAGISYGLNADLTSEYVAGGGVQWLTNYARTLSWAIDDITADFGADVYERMLLEPQVASVFTALKAAVLEDSVSLSPAVTNRTDPGYQQAADMVDFCNAALEGMETAFSDVLWQLLDAMAFGNKLAEQVYHYDSTYTGKSQLVLSALKVKPRASTAFVVNVFNKVVGILGLVPGVGQPVQVGTMLTNPGDQPNLLPRNKFAILTFRPKDSDPRGTSILRPAFTPWWEKQQIRPQFLKYLTQFAGPSLVGVGPENGQAMPQVDANGNLVLDANGNPVMIQPLTALGLALANFQNGSWMTVPFGSEVNPIEMAGEGEAFTAALDRCDREIAKAILSQTLATEEGEHQSRAAATTHQDVMDTIVRQTKTGVATMTRTDILRNLVLYNYGPSYVRYTPLVSVGKVEERDKTSRMQGWAQMSMSYPFTEQQLSYIDEQIGIPVRKAGDPVLTGKTTPAPADGAPPKGAP